VFTADHCRCRDDESPWRGGGPRGGRVIGGNGPARSFYCKKTTSGRLHSWPTRCPKLA